MLLLSGVGSGVTVQYCQDSGTHGGGRSARRAQGHTDRLHRSGGSARYWHSYISCCTASRKSPEDSLHTRNKVKVFRSCCGRTVMFSQDSSPSWHKSPLTPGGQRQLPVTGSQLAPFLHLQGNEQLLPKNPCGHAASSKHKTADHWLYCLVAALACVCVSGCSLWLQTMPIHPLGQSQPVFHGLHFPPFEQSSHVKLQSFPKVSSKHTASKPWWLRLTLAFNINTFTAASHWCNNWCKNTHLL